MSCRAKRGIPMFTTIVTGIGIPRSARNDTFGIDESSRTHALLFRSSQAAGAEGAVVQPMQALGHSGAEQRVMADGEQILGDKPEVLVGGHPVAGVEAGEIDRARKSSQGALRSEIEVHIEITHG